MSKVYLVDTENVASTWLSILPEMTKEDSLLVFYTRNSPGVAYTDLMQIIQYVGKFDCIECFPGANGLDFQLVSYLGYLMNQSPDSSYIIVSRDTGYDAVCKFWSGRGRSVIRTPHVEAENGIQTAGSKKSEEKSVSAGEVPAAPNVPAWLHEKITQAVRGNVVDDDIPSVEECFGDSNDVDQGKVHNMLVVRFGAKKGLELYNLMKPVFRECNNRHQEESTAPVPREQKQEAKLTVRKSPVRSKRTTSKETKVQSQAAADLKEKTADVPNKAPEEKTHEAALPKASSEPMMKAAETKADEIKAEENAVKVPVKEKVAVVASFPANNSVQVVPPPLSELDRPKTDAVEKQEKAEEKTSETTAEKAAKKKTTATKRATTKKTATKPKTTSRKKAEETAKQDLNGTETKES